LTIRRNAPITTWLHEPARTLETNRPAANKLGLDISWKKLELRRSCIRARQNFALNLYSEDDSQKSQPRKIGLEKAAICSMGSEISELAAIGFFVDVIFGAKFGESWKIKIKYLTLYKILGII